MEEVGSFALFARLPAEVRIQIWKEALSVTAVYILQESSVGFEMLSIGPGPGMVSLACQEARWAFRQVYSSPLPAPGLATPLDGYLRVDMDRTVVDMGRLVDMELAVEALGPSAVLRARSVALAWEVDNVDFLLTQCDTLSSRYPNVDTVIIYQVGPRVMTPASRDARNACFNDRKYASFDYLVDKGGPEADVRAPGTTGRLEGLVRYFWAFGPRQPRFHFLGPDWFY